ncbi:NAD(P)-dependent alcohol dehydrogenase [Kushneria phosphatilytica]|uniref:NAD(P)-dependent alcohol dehydrogenase n=1 Tax=Kushneria phosphatilytica TaxID=657387 RepID=A0A1S1NZM9_9GAMM|nr:NAD(P)-dependent alcohol dehydrogenase [Kushneria phosphatilytica]OHV13944.1 hydroxyacid dehydrogenase [Kushneria phosphatilytica]QEL10508.1 NAD(P)-dependent alcohol dehydrogenase [Kushneria phosphatilytica]
MPTQVQAYAAHAADKPLSAYRFERRDLRADDVAIDILYCGVCHSDLHFARNDWGMTSYPIVPGHEIVGRVTAVGSAVTGHQIGDVVGVGCMVDSCRHCQACNEGLEQYCENGFTMTYGSADRHDGTMTQGGYSDAIVVSDRFVVRMPEGIDLPSAAPLMCAGITTYSPLKHYGVKPGHKVGVIGMGGLGHMGVKLAKALGAEVTLFTRSQSKVSEAKRQGADHVVISSDEAQMAEVAETFDFMLDTVPVQHDLNPYLNALRYDGTHILVGLLEPIDPAVNGGSLIFKRRVLAGSLIGGMPETQEVLDFCAENGITCDVEMINIDQINEAFERMQKGDVKYRFVIDMASLKAQSAA